MSKGTFKNEKNKNTKNNVLGLLLWRQILVRSFLSKKTLFLHSFFLFCNFSVFLTCTHAKDSPLKTFLKSLCFKRINSICLLKLCDNQSMVLLFKCLIVLLKLKGLSH